MLGQHPRVVGLGGVDRAMRMLVTEPDKTGQRTCTCGVLARECPYWGLVTAKIAEQKPASLIERYRLALDVFAQVFGEQAWPVDAGQIKEPLYALASEKWIELRVIHLARDVRSSIVSEIDSTRRKRNSSRGNFIVAMTAALRWARENKKLANCLLETRLTNRPLGYEEICLGFPDVFNGIYEFLGLEPVSMSVNVPRPNNHMFIGNRMREQEEKAALKYDGRWLTRREWLAPCLLLPFLLPRNRKWVYANNVFGVFTRQ
jgi:hypothetical protein